MRLLRLLSIFVWTLGSVAVAQERERPQVQERVNDARGSAHEPGGGRFSPVSTPSAPAPSINPMPTSPTPTTSPGGGNTGGGTSGYYSNYYNWVYEYNRFQYFLWELSMRGRFSDYDALGRYARQEPLLTSYLVQSALREPLSYSRALVVQATDLRNLVANLDQDPSLRSTVQERIKAIRQLIKEIEKDRALEYLDLRKTRDAAQLSADKDLKSLAERLYQSAIALHGDIDRLVKDDPQVVKVNQLSSPSYRALAKEIESLAKEISKQTKKG